MTTNDQPSSAASVARLYMLDHATEEQFRIGCATPGLHCQEFPLFAPTLDAARVIAKNHTNERQHVSPIKWVRTTAIEVWAVEPEQAEPRELDSPGPS